jgi:ABC-type dipeptide/oligopeptide/nickel transport system permease subunit
MPTAQRAAVMKFIRRNVLLVTLLALLVLCCNRVGDALRDRFDPASGGGA